MHGVAEGFRVGSRNHVVDQAVSTRDAREIVELIRAIVFDAHGSVRSNALLVCRHTYKDTGLIRMLEVRVLKVELTE